MPAKVIPKVNGKDTTWADIQAMMGGVTRQMAQSKYKKLAAQGAVTMDALTTRYQAPEIAQRKADNLNATTQARILTHARLHGPTHTAGTFNLPREEVVSMLKAATKK